MNRRHLLRVSAAAAAAQLPACALFRPSAPDELIIDTHQHLWDRRRLNLPWLAGAPKILRRDFLDQDYQQAFAGLNVKAIYMEVDVAPEDHRREADAILAKCRARNTATIAATIGGRPADAGFREYLRKYTSTGCIKGLRQVLHGATTPEGYCLTPEFVRGVRTLGKLGLNFELTMRPDELRDGARLIRQCPDTRFVLDHCGNGDPKAFSPRLAKGQKPSCSADEWRRGIDSIAALPGVMCKISGIAAFVPPGKWAPEDLAPVVNHCLDAFGPDRVFFGGDWPVCLLGSSARQWVEALKMIVASRLARDQRKLWSGNAIDFYRLSV